MGLKFGWSEKSITPEKKVSLAGQFAERISQYVEKPLTVTALAVEGQGDHMILCSTDLVAVGWNVVQAVRSRIAARTREIDPKKIIISAIHTHTGPVVPRHSRLEDTGVVLTSDLEIFQQLMPEGMRYVEAVDTQTDPQVATGEAVLELVVSRVADAILEAWETREDGAFSHAFGRAAIGMCRRVRYADGSAQMWGDTNTPNFMELECGSDSGVELMYLFDEHQKLTGIIANVACPAQCVQHRLFVSPDYWGETKKLLRAHFGDDLYLLCLCSAAGDQCPVDLVRWVEPESDLNDPNLKRTDVPARKADPSMFDLAGMYKAGRRLAREIIDVYTDGAGEVYRDVPFCHEVRDLPLPLRRVTAQEAENARARIAEYLCHVQGNADYSDYANMDVHLGTLQRLELQEKVTSLDTEVHLIRLGNIAFATNPFELFLDYGNRIRARSPAQQTFLVQLANGHEGYLPTEKAQRGGHYSAFVSSGKLGHEGGALLVEQTLAGLNALFEG